MISALDIGTTKVVCFIARRDDSDGLNIVGIGHHLSNGMKCGTLVDMDETEHAIRAAVDSAERMAGEQIREVFVNLSGGDPASDNISLQTPVSGPEVNGADIRRLLEQADGLVDSPGRERISTIPVGYRVDGSPRLHEPRGMYGEILSVDLNCVSVMSGAIRNLELCLQRCHLEMAGIVTSAYASGLASLVEDEMEMGAICIDLGGGTTATSVFLDGAMIHTASVYLGGTHITNDIACGLLTPLSYAERLKTLFSSALTCPTDDREIIDIPLVGEEESDNTNRIPRSLLTSIVRPRLEEIFELVRDKLSDTGLGDFAFRRVVLTGGGSQMSGVAEVASRVLDKHVRIGRPIGVSGLADATKGPAFSTCAGLLLYGALAPVEPPRLTSFRRVEKALGPLSRVGSWLRENF